MIKLPHYNWFFQMQGKNPVINVYTGSSGTDPKMGCFSITTFDYTVYVETNVEEGESYHIVAEWHHTFPWGSDPIRSESVRQTFENSPEGLNEATKWLSAAEVLDTESKA